LHHVLGRLDNLKVEIAGQWVPVYFSAGWHQYQRGQKFSELLEAADQDLYRNKRSTHATPRPALVNAGS
jgi:PleD family two-component response regulator